MSFPDLSELRFAACEKIGGVKSHPQSTGFAMDSGCLIFILVWAFADCDAIYFECRAGLQTRLIFRAEDLVLHFLTAGDHDHIRKFLRNL